MPSCVVNWCKSHPDKHPKDSGITFHIFPQNPSRRERWIKAVRLERHESDWMPSKISKICSIHFKDENFYLSKKGFKMLNKSAIPICTMVFSNEIPLPLTTSESRQQTICDKQNENPAPENPLVLTPSKTLQVKICNKVNVTKTSSHRKRRLVSCPSCGHDFSIPGYLDVENSHEIERRQPSSPSTSADSKVPDRKVCSTPLNIPSSDIESAFNTPKTQKLKKVLGKKTLLSEKRLSKIKTLRQRNKRLLKKCVSLKDVTKELIKNRFVDTSLQITLSDVAGDIFSSIKTKQNMKRSIVKYTPAVKKFALTLNYYSPSSYKYVRRQFHSCLPHPSTLSKWYQVIDANPGFTEEAFRALRTKLSQSDKRLACLMVDEMAIRQQKTFNGKEVEGLVTFGPSDEIATQAYVLMLVSLNDAFKLPLGYFLINGMSAEQRANIIKTCLQKCHEVNAEIVSLTFDGCAANLATAKLLGCNFENPDNLKTFFSHPANGKPVVVFLDPSHMVKLVRNTLESKKGFTDKNGEFVEWRYLQELEIINRSP